MDDLKIFGRALPERDVLLEANDALAMGSLFLKIGCTNCTSATLEENCADLENYHPCLCQVGDAHAQPEPTPSVAACPVNLHPHPHQQQEHYYYPNTITAHSMPARSLRVAGSLPRAPWAGYAAPRRSGASTRSSRTQRHAT